MQCSACGKAASCVTCVEMMRCEDCTATARCGSCRGRLSRARRAEGVCSAVATPQGQRRVRARTSAGESDRREWPRDREGYYKYLSLVGEMAPRSVARAGARWLIDPAAPDLLHEAAVAKDSYETPAWLVEHYVSREGLTVDVGASALNAVAPTYITAADPPSALGALSGVGLWLNPAFGPRCRNIAGALERVIAGAVRERGCWLVALLPVYSFKTWCAPSQGLSFLLLLFYCLVLCPVAPPSLPRVPRSCYSTDSLGCIASIAGSIRSYRRRTRSSTSPTRSHSSTPTWASRYVPSDAFHEGPVSRCHLVIPPHHTSPTLTSPSMC